MRHTRRKGVGIYLLLALLLVGQTFYLAVSDGQSQGLLDCTMTQTGKVPLPDLGANQYCRDGHCELGGLYPGGSPLRPPSLEADALQRAQQIQPLDANGNPDPAGGKIIMISIGMSNTAMAFDDPAPDVSWTAFLPRANDDPAKNPQLVIINGAQGEEAADAWVDPDAPPWQVVKDRISGYGGPRNNLGLSPDQVQVVWVKQALRETGPFPDYAQELGSYLEAIARNVQIHFPNVKLAYFTSRTYAYIMYRKGEPDTYEGGFSIRWMIEKQMEGDPSLNPNPEQGQVQAPLLLWGPYLWTDGMTPRSDGLVWSCAADGDMWNGIHPAPNGAQKNADQLYAFFKTDPTTTPWYLRKNVVGQAPTVTASADVTSGPAPLTVQFSATANDPDGQVVEYVWSFGDGTFSYNPDGGLDSPPYYLNQNPTKTFYSPGVYPAYLTVTDNNGNAVTSTLTIEVSGEGIVAPAEQPTAASSEAPATGEDEAEDTATEPEPEVRETAAPATEEPAAIVLAADAVSPTEINLSWTRNDDDQAGYKIERSLDGNGNWAGLAKVGPGVTAFTDTDVRPGTTYYYRVISITGSGIELISNGVAAAPVRAEPTATAAPPLPPATTIAEAPPPNPTPAPPPPAEDNAQPFPSLPLVFSVAGLGLGATALLIALRGRKKE